ncbi:hypothetical protein [Endozoicomonas sp. ONNA2]|uniref:hypothetical protein n=1 Tax=Endozoicomonas sp. ONNA2 TaxID=2828741 RepID=UPI002148B25A|nr:hypothetical protein [Endozoicomonas sp. ONNA2]
MKLTEITSAAKGVYDQTLQSNKGFIRALSSAASCFFNRRKVENWHELNTVAAPEGRESEEEKTSINDRTTAPRDMQSELKSVLENRALAVKSRGSDSELEGEYDSAGIKGNDQEASVAEPNRTAKQSEPADDTLIPGSGGEKLNHKAARDKIEVRPRDRRPPTRKPGRH